MRIPKILLALAATAFIVSGCTNLKEPATQALAAAEASLATVKDDAAKFAPEALQGVETTLNGLKESLAKGDYKAVMAGAPQLTSAVDSLKQTVAAKKAEAETAMAAATAEWSTLAADVPKMVEAIQSRVDILSKSPKLPKNVDKAAFEAAKSGLDTMKSTWAEASAAFTAGNAGEAVDKAKMVKQKGEEVLKQLGMSAG